MSTQEARLISRDGLKVFYFLLRLARRDNFDVWKKLANFDRVFHIILVLEKIP